MVNGTNQENLIEELQNQVSETREFDSLTKI